MKPRKPDESDAEYIQRLETAYAAVSAQNKRWRKDWRRMTDTLLPAAGKAGLIVAYAAEVTGMKDDSSVKAASDGLSKLAESVWNDDHFEIPDLPKLPPMKAEAFGGDAEMILHSALEQVKQSRAPWDSWDDIVPQYKGKNPADLDWEDIAGEVFDAVADLEVSRGILRLDLRSAMYDHCFIRIQRAVNEASHRVREDRFSECDYGTPF